MDEKNESRIIFYSSNDLSGWWHLQKAEKILEEIDFNKEFRLNEYLEFYHIRQYFKNEVFLKKWSDKQKEIYIEKSNKLWKMSILFIKSINNQNIKSYIEDLNFHYEDCFWELVCKFKIHEKILCETLWEILIEKPYCIKILLKNRKIISYFQEKVRNFMIDHHEDSLEILLYYAKNNWKWFPEDLLTREDKEKIITLYLKTDWEKSTHHLENIFKLWGVGFLKISKKTIKIAKDKHKQFIKNFFKTSHNTIKYSYKVSLSMDQEEDMTIKNGDFSNTEIVYSVKFYTFLYENQGFSHLFQNIFKYLDSRWNIELVTKQSDISPFMELFISNLPREYKRWPAFEFKEAYSILNIVSLICYLKDFHNKHVSFIIEYFKINISLYDWFEKIVFKTDSLTRIDDYWDLIKIIIPEFDLFIKQFICYVEEWEIDLELLSLQDWFLYEEIPSLLENKYFYENGKELESLKYHFFSDQSGLFYIKWYENKHHNFYDLISKEKLKISNFADYQKDTLKFFLKEDILYIDTADVIQIKNKIFIFLVWEIFKKEVLSYHWYTKSIQEEIIVMEESWLLYSKSTLLSTLESSYFNYYLKDKEFINSCWIRNKNLHGFSYVDESTAYNDYLIILKLIVLIFLKIEDELFLRERIIKSEESKTPYSQN